MEDDSIVESENTATSDELTAGGSGWVSVHSKINRIGSAKIKSSSSEGNQSVNHSEATEKTIAEVLVNNSFASLLETDESETSDLDPKKRKLSSVFSLENE